MEYPKIENYSDSSDELNFADYLRFPKVKRLFELIHEYDQFPATPVEFGEDGKVDMSKRFKQNNIKADWLGSWYDIEALIDETKLTLYKIIEYYGRAVRAERVLPGDDDMYPGEGPAKGWYNDPYYMEITSAQVFFIEFYPRYKKLAKWAELGMDLFVQEHTQEIKDQNLAIRAKNLIAKSVPNMTGDDIIQLLELYDELKARKPIDN